jgi:exodeoxyribonuclease VII large subunit
VEYLRGRILRVGPHLADRPRARFEMAAARLEDLSPLAILGRGYSATFAEDGHAVVKSISQVQPGDLVQVRVSDGRILATVTETVEEKR